jgi:nifR3 family TIM-barrel protein
MKGPEGWIRLLPPRPWITLAPMAGYTDHPFRLLCKEGGADFVCTELLSANALHYRQSRRTYEMMDWTDEERPVGSQIFGAEPDFMAEAALAVRSQGCDVIDINLGCSVPKILRTGASAALCRDMSQLKPVLEAVVQAADCPVTIKIRAGWDSQCINAPELAQLAEKVGVAAVAVHGRTSSQGFSGISDWGIIAKTKAAVSIPVLGSGDVVTPEDAEMMLEETKADGIMVGRGAWGDPWTFRRIKTYLVEGKRIPAPSATERLEMLLRHLLLMTAQKGERVGLVQMRMHAPNYLKGLPGASELRGSFMKTETLEEAETLIGAALEEMRCLEKRDGPLRLEKTPLRAAA